jgi:gamma-tubulin complex component 5
VYNEDPLADALKERVEKVMKLQSKWTPEILHLLLELSDRPLVNAKVEDLDFLKEPEPESEPPLRWQDLMAEDPLLREKSVWRNVDFGAESSDDAEFDDSSSERSETTEVTTQSSVEENIGRRPQDYLIDVADKGILLELRDAQFWLKDPMVGGVKLDTVKKPITELQAIREVLFMLSGYPTSLFKVQSHNPNIIFPSKSYTLKHASVEAFHKQLHAFAEQGTALQSLRLWVRQSQTIPLIQVFQDAVSKQLMQFEGRLSDIQTRYVELPSDVVVSILQVQAEVTSLTRFLLKLVDIVKK